MNTPEPQSTPKFSIVTVTLNPGPGLKRTVQSIINQSYVDWEIVIKDGFSTDGSLNELPEDARIRIERAKDLNIFDAMNQALTYVAGEYINFLNAGDTFYSDHVLQHVSDVIDKHPDSVFLYGDVNKPMSRSGYEFYPDRLSRFYLFNRNICHQAWFVYKDQYASTGGFDTDLPVGGDPRFLLKMLLRDNVPYQHVSQVVVTYEGNGISSTAPNVEIIERSMKNLKQQLYSNHEFVAFSIYWEIHRLVKKVLFDHLLYKPWRVIQGIRAKKRN